MSRWWFTAKYVETCNCDFGCPCNYTQIPSHGTCTAVSGYAITAGRFDDVDLAGVTFGLMAAFPGPIHEGGGHGLVVIDETASPAQVAAIAELTSGDAGPGGPFEILAATFDGPHEVVTAPVTFEVEGKRARLAFGDYAGAVVGPIIGDMGHEANVRMVIPDGFIFTDGDMVAVETGFARSMGLDFTLSNSNAFIADVAYNVA